MNQITKMSFLRRSLSILHSSLQLCTPGAQGFQYRCNTAPFCGENVFKTGRVLFVQAPLDQSTFLKRFQSRRQSVRRASSHRIEQVLKSPRRVQVQVAQDQDCPALANRVERGRNWAVCLWIDSWHDFIISNKSSKDSKSTIQSHYSYCSPSPYTPAFAHE